MNFLKISRTNLLQKTSGRVLVDMKLLAICVRLRTWSSVSVFLFFEPGIRSIKGFTALLKADVVILHVRQNR